MSSPLRITIFAFDLPYPPNRGGRADIWRRIVALNKLGCEIMLVCWQDGPEKQTINPAHENAIMAHVAKLVIHTTKRGFIETINRLARLPFAPSHATSRRLSGCNFLQLQQDVSKFKPHAIWLEGPYPSYTGAKLAQLLDLPYFYRSHNIEHLYMARQAAAAKSLRDKLAWYIACIGLEKFELKLMRDAKCVFDISADDLEFWQAKGIQYIQCLPPLPEVALLSELPSIQEKTIDVLFLGNLRTPNNVRGVEFLVNEVMPLVLTKRPQTKFTIAGSNPTSYVKSLLLAKPSVQILENVPDATSVFQSARVLVNPVMTGSGVMVKILDMLMTDVPIVSSQQGACGLPDSVKTSLRIADDANAFAKAIVEELDHPSADIIERQEARTLFTLQRIEDLVTELCSKVTK